MHRRSLLPWFDVAYQGFASGDPDEDAWSVREFLRRGFEILVCQSFAKSFGVYCERVRALHVVLFSKSTVAAVLSHVERIVLPMCSNPPAHGALIVARVLSDSALCAEWRAELRASANRIKHMRSLLVEALRVRGTPGDWSHISRQIGLFTFSGLSAQQSTRMTREFHIYMQTNGRMNMAGFNSNTVGYLADSWHSVVTNT
jgi:aspartate aminotransferase